MARSAVSAVVPTAAHGAPSLLARPQSRAACRIGGRYVKAIHDAASVFVEGTTQSGPIDEHEHGTVRRVEAGAAASGGLAAVNVVQPRVPPETIQHVRHPVALDAFVVSITGSV